MELNKYQEKVKATKKEFKDSEKEIMTWGLGLAGEAGDVASCIKKTIAHDNDQTAGIKENLGDVLWYIGAICNFYNWTMDEIIAENVQKLKKRYPDGFKFENAQRNRTKIDWGEK